MGQFTRQFGHGFARGFLITLLAILILLIAIALAPVALAHPAHGRKCSPPVVVTWPDGHTTTTTRCHVTRHPRHHHEHEHEGHDSHGSDD